MKDNNKDAKHEKSDELNSATSAAGVGADSAKKAEAAKKNKSEDSSKAGAKAVDRAGAKPAEPAETAADDQAKAETAANSETAKTVDLDVDELSSESAEKTKQIEALETEVAKLKDSQLRLMAEFDNFKRRSQKEKDRIYQDALVDVNKEWLQVIDNLERASETINTLDKNANVNQYKEAIDGVLQIEKQGKKILAGLKIEEIPALGEKFDPNLHEAVLRDENSEAESGTITEVLLKGYKYGDKVIRHSVVKVAD